MKVKYAIIGGGSAGLTARAEIAKITDDYVIIERKNFGTTCASVGCMPSKALIHLAEDYHGAKFLAKNNLIDEVNLKPNGQKIMEHVRAIRDRLSGGIIKKSAGFEDKKIMGEAHFVDEHTLEVNGQQIEAEKIIIASGSTPIVPEAWGKLSSNVITSDQVFELGDLPESLAVIGMGPIGIELGQSFSHLGVKVYGFDMADTVAGIQDPDVGKTAIEHFSKDFELNLGKPVEVSKGQNKELKVGQHEVDMVLLALGRKPNIDQLQLNNVSGLDFDDRGMPLFDPHTMQVGNSDIFIAGDANGFRPILHEASDEGRMAAANAVSKKVISYERKIPMGISFTDPNVAFVGQRYDKNLAVGEMNLSMLGRTISMNRPYGLIRVYGDKKTKKIVGAEMACPKAENLVHMISVMIEQAYSLEQALNLPFYHPVLEEGLKNAIRSLAQNMGENVLEIRGN